MNCGLSLYSDIRKKTMKAAKQQDVKIVEIRRKSVDPQAIKEGKK